MKRQLAISILLLHLVNVGTAQEKPALPYADRVRLAEALRLNSFVSDRVWKGWSKIPFAVLLITQDYEFLIRHPQPSSDFSLIGYDPLLKSKVYFRKRIFSKRLQATFPAIQPSPISTIVIGEAESTESGTSTPWVITLMHEHFHQLQTSQATYYVSVNALNLSRGDKTGMWMLNYAFPYDQKEVQDQFLSLSKLLVNVVNTETGLDRGTQLTEYLRARSEFERALKPDDYKYFSFQLWQEGIAHYTEYRVAKLAAAKYHPGKQFRALKDFTSFADAFREIRDTIINQLSTQRLGEKKREVVYPFGAAEALLLDEVNPSWQSRYFVDRFDLRKYFDTSASTRREEPVHRSHRR